MKLPALRSLLLAAGLVLLAACDQIPKDPDGTLDRIRSGGKIRVGLVAMAGERPVEERAFLNRLIVDTKAVTSAQSGSAENLLTRLEGGDLDLVLGEFHSSSPWSKRVTFIPTLASQAKPDERMVVAAAVANGENRWIALVHNHQDALGTRP